MQDRWFLGIGKGGFVCGDMLKSEIVVSLFFELLLYKVRMHVPGTAWEYTVDNHHLSSSHSEKEKAIRTKLRANAIEDIRSYT